MIAASPENVSFHKTLPGRYYTDSGIFEQEVTRIFSKMWICVGREESVANAGQYFLAEIGDESIIVVRGRDGQLRAFYNVCQHRGARVCQEAAGQLKNTIQCPYHAWSYGLDGRLIGAPNIFQNEQFDRESHGLRPVAVSTWEGLVWLNLSDPAESLAEQMQHPIQDRFGENKTLDRYGIGSLKVGKRITYEVAANWKLCVENFMECYHCGPVHPELCRLIPVFRGGQSYQLLPGVGSPFAEDISAFTLSGEGERPRLPGLLEEDDRLYYGFMLWPNVFVNLLPDHVILHTAIPRGPAHTTVICDWLFTPDEVADPTFDSTPVVEVFDLVNRQDWEMCQLTQQGMKSRAYAEGGLYVPAESHLYKFNAFIRKHLGEPL